jgi:hypothetical protein
VVTKPAKYMVGVFLTQWIPSHARRDFPFCGPGPLVGMAERLVVLVLVLSGWFPAAVLATVAKVVVQQIGPFRDPDPEVRRFDFIGDLTSLGLAWVVALLAAHYA